MHTFRHAVMQTNDLLALAVATKKAPSSAAAGEAGDAEVAGAEGGTAWGTVEGGAGRLAWARDEGTAGGMVGGLGGGRREGKAWETAWPRWQEAAVSRWRPGCRAAEGAGAGGATGAGRAGCAVEAGERGIAAAVAAEDDPYRLVCTSIGCRSRGHSSRRAHRLGHKKECTASSGQKAVGLSGAPSVKLAQHVTPSPGRMQHMSKCPATLGSGTHSHHPPRCHSRRRLRSP